MAPERQLSQPAAAWAVVVLTVGLAGQRYLHFKQSPGEVIVRHEAVIVSRCSGGLFSDIENRR